MNAAARTRSQRPHIRRQVGGTVALTGLKGMSGLGKMAGMPAAPKAPRPPSIAQLLKRIMK